MMLYRFTLVAALMTAPPALAQGPFDLPAVADAALADARAGSAPAILSISVRQLRSIQDNEAQESFRLVGSVARIGMDNWWAGDGAALILAADPRSPD